MKLFQYIILTATLGYTAPLNAETETVPIPFSEIGAKATADYQGDAIGITSTPDGARLHTGFQKLAGYVTSAGLTLVSTEEDGGSLKLNATSIGRDSMDAPSPVISLPAVGKVLVEENVVRWIRSGLVEEYSVSADGVRQDFIVAASPAGKEELIVELALTGARAESQGDGVRLTIDASGRELAYARLRVEDATGRVLAARMEVLGADRLAVRVEDACAVYPVRIDPTFSDADWVNTLNSSIPGASGTVHAAVADGSGNLYIGGAFTLVGSLRASYIAKWNGSAWSALGTGMNNSVRALALSGNDLYAGGDFTMAGGVAGTSYISKWDGSAWSALGTGMNVWVYALAVSGADLYVGGSFTTAGGVSANRIAKWNGSAWSSLGTGMNNTVYSLAVSGADLYSGGEFTMAGGVSSNRVAKWNGSAWSALGTGMDNVVAALAVSGTDLYAGGNFTTAGGVTVNRIAKWNGSVWSPLGTGMDSSFVLALAVSGTDLYAGGNFTIAGGVTVNRIAKWNGSEWSALGTGLSGSVNSLAVSGTDIYAGGVFTTAGAANRIAKWNGSIWSALGTGVNSSILALALSGTDLYAGGFFTTANGVADTSYIAKWNGSIWSALGTGMNNAVWALAVIGSDLYAGGNFTTAGGVTVNRIAKWDGTVWSALDTGMNSSVYSLAIIGTNLYAGGGFTMAGDVSANLIAKWNGSMWSALGTGMNSSVLALAVSGTDLYAGGQFTTAGGVAGTSYIAKWNGVEWSALGTGVNSSVRALESIGTNLYAGGQFTTAGGVAGTSYIAKWNGTDWSALGTGMNNAVWALAVFGTDLYTGGIFTTAGGVTVNRIAKWNGSTWSALGTGVDNYVRALALDSNGQLVLGGDFSLAGTTTVAPFIVQANITTPTPEIAISGNGQNIAAGDASPDAADGTAFGNVVVSGGPAARTFTITNSGTAVLNLTGTAPDYVTLSGSGAFSVTSQPTAATIPTGGGTRTFQITFDPETIGSHTATVSISSSDADENPFVIALSGQGITAQAAADAAIAAAGLMEDDAKLDATPFDDGVENLLKYAFNMKLSGPDSSTMSSGGSAGLPSISRSGEGPNRVFRYEFVQRIGSGLVYTPKKNASLDPASWVPLTDTPTIVPINANWQRVIYEEPADPALVPTCFGILEVIIPSP